MTGVPTFKLVNFDALLVTYPPNSFDFFISGKSLKYLVLRLKILKIFFDNFLFFISPGYTETSVSSLFIFPVNLNLNQSLHVKMYLIFFKFSLSNLVIHLRIGIVQPYCVIEPVIL